MQKINTLIIDARDKNHRDGTMSVEGALPTGTLLDAYGAPLAGPAASEAPSLALVTAYVNQQRDK